MAGMSIGNDLPTFGLYGNIHTVTNIVVTDLGSRLSDLAAARKGQCDF